MTQGQTVSGLRRLTIFSYSAPPVAAVTMDRDRMKYLFREILGVDVDEVVRKVVATIAVERAKQAQKNTTDWKRYMEAEGGIVILPSNVTQLGRKDSKP
jgi:hypothetical protein